MLIPAGKSRKVPGIITNWKDDPSKRIRRIILHTTCGIPGGKDQRPQLILEGISAPNVDSIGIEICQRKADA